VELTVAIIAIVVAFGAVLVSVWAVFSAEKSSQAQVEAQIRQQINDAENYKDDKIVQFYSMSKDASEESIENLQAVMKSAEQRLINVYDDACALYLDGKIDKQRFKQNYEHTIIRNMKNVVFQRDYFFAEPNEYPNTLAVFREWTE